MSSKCTTPRLFAFLDPSPVVVGTLARNSSSLLPDVDEDNESTEVTDGLVVVTPVESELALSIGMGWDDDGGGVDEDPP
jgi:hypothetical protein